MTHLAPMRDEAEPAFDADMLIESVRRMLAAGPGDWDAVTAMELTALGQAGFGGLEDAVRVIAEFGRAGSRLPIAERIALNLVAPGLAADASRIALAFGEMGGDAGAGAIRREGDTISGTLRLVEGAEGAERLVVCLADGLAAIACADAAISATPAMAGGFADVRFDAARIAAHVEIDIDDLLAVYRLLLCARALGAAEQGTALVTDYAKVRRQFGQAIGSFQAIQHKLANNHIALSAVRLQLVAAARAFDTRASQHAMLARAAVAYASPTLRRVALETQHAFGAIGFAEEHAAPTLFRRVHADTARLGGGAMAARRLGEMLLAGGAKALSVLLASEADPAAGFRETLRAWLAENWTDEHACVLAARPFAERDWDMDFLARLGAGGWTALNWPKAAGGMDATPFEQLAFTEELLHVGAPEHAMICPCRIIAPEIIAHGSDTLVQELLPRLRAGAVTGCLGYSEPESGSDLASLRTLALPDERGDYIVNGQKIWTTDGHRASHMILAARTDADPRSRHAGISLFILPMDTPGISIRRMTGLHGHVFCNIFFDDVRLPAHYRLGEEGQGWAILSNALANERITMGGFVSRLAIVLGRVIDALASRRDDPAAQTAIGDLAAQLVAGRALALDSIAKTAQGRTPLVEAAMAKVHASELAQTICERSLDLIGGIALLGTDAPDAPADGLVDEILRLSIMYVVGGGSNEIQRSLIAGRGLALGR